MRGSSRGLESGSTKEGELHHIATDHGPMVQGGLLKVHTGGVHGYGWSPGGGISFRQGARAASPGSPDLETAAAGGQSGFRGKGFLFWESPPGGRKRGEGGPRQAPQGRQEGARRGPRWGRARDPCGSLVVAPLPFFGSSGSFLDADFLCNFSS